MKQLSIKTWVLTERDTSSELLVALASKFTLELDVITESTMTFLDDADVHLWRANYLLYSDNKQHFRLIDPTGTPQTIHAVQGVKFWWHISASPAQNTVKHLIGLRALMPIASMHMREQHIALRNDDQKLIVRACFNSITMNAQTTHYCSITALRGYAKEFARAANIMAPFAHDETTAFDLKQLLAEHMTPVFAQATCNLPPLIENMPAEQAVRTMAMVMLQQASRHVPGVIADIDTEFLHHFRVSLRKLRSLISLLQKALPSATVSLLKPALSALAGVTNKLRDLDVFLVESHDYRAMLPATFSAGLHELYVCIEQQREHEKTKVARYFSSAGYTHALAMCTLELSAPAVLQTSISARPLLPVIKKLLFARYHKMLTMSTKIHSHTLDEEVHELRIEFKKLRYLIEFSSSLLPPKRIHQLMGEVKKIQAVLGTFNDYSVQIAFLSTYIDDSRIEMSKALSGLIAIVHQHKIIERNKVDTVLADFFTPAMSTEIEFLFGATASGVSP